MTNNGLWGLLLLMEVLPVFFLVVGRVLLSRPPRLGKGVLSFRGRDARRDEAHWALAQKYYGQRLTKTMPILMIAGAMACMALQRAAASRASACMAAWIAIAVEVISVIVCYGLTMRRLKRQPPDQKDK